MAKSEDIKIASLDVDASRPSGRGALQDMVLRLNRSAPGPWQTRFALEWQQHFSMMKRAVQAYSDRLVVECMPDELETGLLEELQKVVSITNDWFNAEMAAQAEAAKRAKQEEDERKAKLSDVASRLKF